MIALTIAEVCQLIGGLCGQSSEIKVGGVATYKRARDNELGIIDAGFEPDLVSSQACAFLASKANPISATKPVIYVENLKQSAKILAAHFMQATASPVSMNKCAYSRSIISDDAQIDPSAIIGPGSIIGPHCRIGKHAKLGLGVTLVGQVDIGDGVFIDAGTVIGSQPFSMIKEKGRWLHKNALGGVVIEDNTHIGANVTIDCGSWLDTWVGRGCQIDNLVHIAGDCRIGAHTAIAGQAVLGAKANIGKHCIIGGAALIAGNLFIVENTTVTGGTTVSRSLRNPDVYSSGITAKSHHKWRKNLARFHYLDKLAKKIRKLEKITETDENK